MALDLLVEIEDLLNDFGVQLCVAQDLLHAVDQVLCLLSHGQVGQVLLLERGHLPAHAGERGRRCAT